jgi:hypothetical protein
VWRTLTCPALGGFVIRWKGGRLIVQLEHVRVMLYLPHERQFDPVALELADAEAIRIRPRPRRSFVVSDVPANPLLATRPRRPAN